MCALPLILGVTGGIASGKSLVSEMFRQLGALVISADQLARDIVEPGGEVHAALRRRFGDGVLLADGRINRDQLGRLIFDDARARRDLNAITHPAIARLAEQRLAEARRLSPALIVYEAPLLFEAEARGRVDAVLVVQVDAGQQLRRLMARDRIAETEAQRRMAAQFPLEVKIARADHIIDNSGTPQATRRQVEALFARLANKKAPLLEGAC